MIPTSSPWDRTARKEPTTTFDRTRRGRIDDSEANKQLRKQIPGFSLIEVMIVVIIIAMMMAGVGLSVGATDRVKLRSSAWILMAGVRFAYSRAVTSGSTTRLVLDFGNKSLHIEETKKRVVLTRTDETGAGLRREDEEERQEEEAARKDDFLDLSGGSGLSSTGSSSAIGGGLGGLGFGGDGSDGLFGNFEELASDEAFLSNLKQQFNANVMGYKPPTFKPLPGKRGKNRSLEGENTQFLKVFTPHDPEPREEGRAYIYFFPNGTAEHAFVQLSDGDERVFTVEIHPLTGKSYFFNEAVEPEEELDELQEASD
jgi:general secretion pathway protein H